ncbi:hypothetical protein O7627_18940 [Solwaraspora sp. WMMD1047]|uniref:hypothetical protein n=1 Tax=Solwaraspora sp. WMMD1047 TaxID=3016102 RepID=UPI0024168056|nr:hypothetical protein [Solwaraspora sp. WMMD1047]MDG4831377.1 hypothetical protein [Solwaraspora sp. WMMD1047]
MEKNDEEPRPRAGGGRRWRSISDRRIGGHHPLPGWGRPRLKWIDTGSGPGVEVPEEDADRWRVPPFPTGTLSGGWGPPVGWGGCLESANDPPRVAPDHRDPDRPAPSVGPTHGPAVFPDAIPATVQADTLRALLKLHEAADENTCHCGLPLGEETGLCWYGWRAQRALLELQLDHRADHPEGPDL